MSGKAFALGLSLDRAQQRNAKYAMQSLVCLAYNKCAAHAKTIVSNNSDANPPAPVPTSTPLPTSAPPPLIFSNSDGKSPTSQPLLLRRPGEGGRRQEEGPAGKLDLPGGRPRLLCRHPPHRAAQHAGHHGQGRRRLAPRPIHLRA